ncbi:MAG: WD40 repeat domain-containing serine/threonine protein kinase [Planctomycetota bacterium]
MSENQLEHFLDLWMADRDRGITRTAMEVCAGNPELVEELSRRIRIIKRFEELADITAAGTPASQGEVGTSHAASAPGTSSMQRQPMPATIGHFRPLEILGEGGMGSVYLAEDPHLQRRVAVKVMKRELAADPHAKHRFLREARAMATIEHENIMTIYSVGEDQGTPYLVMPVLKGETLDERLRRENRLSVSETCRIAREIAAGLEAAHSHGLIHRDIKPSNIWLEGVQGRVRILDFGLARPASEDQKVTHSGAVLGTPAYMAPEQAAGTEATPRSDLFSLGAVLYRMTTGKQPFDGPNIMATLNNLANRIPESPSKLAPEVPLHISMMIDQLLAKTPERRPESAKDVLKSFQVEETLSLPAITIVPVPPKKPAKHSRDQSESGTPRSATRLKPKASSAGGFNNGFRRLLMGGLAALTFSLAVVVYRIQTNHGTLVVMIDDEQVEARLSKQGLVIEDAQTGRTWKLSPNKPEPLPSGNYRLSKSDGLLLNVSDDDGAEFTTTEFRIKRSDRTTVRVTLEPAKEMESATAAYGAFVKFSEPWKVAPRSDFRTDGTIEAAWSGPHGSNILIYTRESSMPVHPVDLMTQTAAELKQTVDATIGTQTTRTIAGMQAMWLVTHGRGTGAVIDGKGTTPTTQHWVAIPREQDIFFIRLSCPSADYAGFRAAFEESLQSIFMIGSQTKEQRSTKVPGSPRSPIPSGDSPFDKLDFSQIPEAERVEYLPKETVAVLGSSHGRTWRSPFFAMHGNMEYSPDGKWLVESDFSNLYLFDAETLALKKRFFGVGQFLRHRWASFSPDSRTLYLTTSNGSANSATDLTSPELNTSYDNIRFGDSTVIANTPDDIWFAGDLNNREHTLWVARRDATTQTLNAQQPIQDVTGVPESSSLGDLAELKFSPDGQWLISGHSTGGTSGYRILRKLADEFVPVAIIPANTDQYNVRVAYSFTSDHQIALLLAGDFCHQVDLSLPPDRPVPEGGFAIMHPEPLTGISDVTTSADGQTWAASKSTYGMSPAVLVGAWEGQVPVVRHTITLPATGLGHVALSPDGKSLAVSMEACVIGLYDLTQEAPVAKVMPDFSSTAQSATSNLAVTARDSGVLELHRQEKDGTKILDRRTTNDPMYGVEISDDGRRVVSFSHPDSAIGGNSRFKIWEIVGDQLVEGATIEAPPYCSGRFFRDGTRFLYANQIWDVTANPVNVIATFARMPIQGATAVSDDGDRVALIGDGNRLAVFSTDRLADAPIATAQLPGAPSSTAFSPDGQRIITTHPEAVCILWDLAGDQLVESGRMPIFQGAPYHTLTSEFSGNGKSVYIGGWGSVLEWKLDDNSLGRHWPIPGSTWIKRTADGRHLILRNSNTTTWILRLTP